MGENDDPDKAGSVVLPSTLFVEATSAAIDLFLLRRDCQEITSATVIVRGRSNKNTQVYRAPHVLVAKGYTSVAFVDFDVSFRHALRGIHGPADHSP